MEELTPGEQSAYAQGSDDAIEEIKMALFGYRAMLPYRSDLVGLCGDKVVNEILDMIEKGLWCD